MKIFISYRRDDSAGHTGRLYDSLEQHFGPESVFMDLSAIESGQNFVDAIKTGVGSCDVLIAVIGDEWLTCTGPNGRRLDDAQDFVRAEIAAALDRGTPVIPVLVEAAAMPPADALPDPLKPLASRHAHELSDNRWSHDVRRLIQATEKLAGKRRRMPWRTWLPLTAGVVLVVILGAVFLSPPLQVSDEPEDMARAPVPGAASEASGTNQAAASLPLPSVRLAGEWNAEVTYYRGTTYTERFRFKVDGNEVFGTVSYLGVNRAILDGTLSGDRLVFSTRTQLCYGDCQDPIDVVHRYRGRISGDAITFDYMQIEDGSAAESWEFTAKRVSESDMPATPE
jgi:hypothetical protein